MMAMGAMGGGGGGWVGSVMPVVTDNHAVEEAGMTEKTVTMETLAVMVTTVVYPRANNQRLILPTKTILIRDWNTSKSFITYIISV